MQSEKNHQDDEIDLKELVNTILDHKKFILIFTVVVVALSIVYVLLAKPTYEVSALVKLGTYTTLNGEVRQFEDGKIAETWLKNVFVDLRRNMKDKEYEIVEVALEKQTKEFLRIKSEARSNELAIKGINELLSYYGKREQSYIDAIKQKYETEIQGLNLTIENTRNNVIKSIDQEMALSKERVKLLESQLLAINNSLKETKRLDPNVVSLKISEKKSIEDDVTNRISQINKLFHLKSTVETQDLSELVSRKSQLEQLLSSNNVRTYEIVEKLQVLDYPVKPKKALIVAISFLTGSMLAIFLVFFGRFVRNFREKIRVG